MYELKYGCNPNQKPAEIRSVTGKLPFKVLNGNPGYINFMDALNSWQLVKELKTAIDMPAAASFKHVSPAGAAIGLPLTDELKKAYFVEDIELSPLASAYIRSRGADRVSSFGDWAALSDIVDKSTAFILKREVSDGIIAPGYTQEAFEILKQKKGGKYNIVEIDPAYEPSEIETRQIFGIEFVQKRNNHIAGYEDIKNIVTENKEIPDNARRDMILAMITLKYTQSNSVCYVLNGQVVGCGAGQQSRIHCTRLAGDKADIWYLKQHPKVLSLKFKQGVGRPERDNAIDLFVRNDVTDYEINMLNDVLETVPERLTGNDKMKWLEGLKNVSLGSDAFFPFRDNIDRAYQSGVKYIAQPGGSVRDDIVINACNEYKMVMAMTGVRLFHH
ncbi:phosphoribosylaminoimidazolecarboxamide formyltransferase [Pseudobacteroides cellulosolvens]|uniref:Phosphoribosylaminoimidazolecarboxamide formyltransferase n=1 Tax=Pseudobacteroides cellulosolvens ATCC 35603 = DSM 2933 TaxID=398512 RepID=A0A0L6JR18_9FIRM|nr:phosphoribosylaminoimidazolecarboxamide formyltransferase [Pseudobacteroides cellulosolvens]KNY28281.1 Phosphoribosylaminoimidazolecarboxamide formyltransferase [Pseudobacteroides cellulosolvens ATCC 35603 = DSM 2933]